MLVTVPVCPQPLQLMFRHVGAGVRYTLASHTRKDFIQRIVMKAAI